MYNQNKVGEMPELQEGVHFEIVKDKNGYSYKYAILDHEMWCPKEGIVEIRRMKNNLTLAGTPKNDDEVVIKRFKDRKTGLLFGLHNGVDDRTGMIQHTYAKLDGNMMFDLSIPQDRRLYIMAMYGPSVEGSPNQSGKPAYKVFDKQLIASKNIDTRKLKRKVEDIIESLHGSALEEMAENIGVNVKANRNHQMLLDEVYRVADNNPRKFIEIYESKDREFITIFNKAVSLGIIKMDFATNTYSFGGIPLGYSKEAAINYLIEKPGIASSIKVQCDDIDKGTSKSMAFVKDNVDPEKEAMRKRIAELEALAKGNKSEVVVTEEVSVKSEDEEMVALRLEAKELKVAGYGLPSISKDKLKSKIEEAKAKLA